MLRERMTPNGMIYVYDAMQMGCTTWSQHGLGFGQLCDQTDTHTCHAMTHCVKADSTIGCLVVIMSRVLRGVWPRCTEFCFVFCHGLFTILFRERSECVIVGRTEPHTSF
jgi:hypothetical protein